MGVLQIRLVPHFQLRTSILLTASFHSTQLSFLERFPLERERLFLFSRSPARALGLERPLLWPCPLSRAPHGARPMMRLALAEARRRAGLPRAASPSWSLSLYVVPSPRRRWQSSACGRFSRARVILPACRSSPSTIFPFVFLEV